MSDDRSSKAKGRWQRAKEVAAALDIGVKVAWSNLRTLEHNELVDPILAGIDEARELALDIIDQPRNQDFKAKANDVKLMLWAFDKIGDVKRIKVAYEKALSICE